MRFSWLVAMSISSVSRNVVSRISSASLVRLLMWSIQASFSACSVRLVLSSVSLSNDALLPWSCPALVHFPFADSTSRSISLLASSFTFFRLCFTALARVCSSRLNGQPKHLALRRPYHLLMFLRCRPSSCTVHHRCCDYRIESAKPVPKQIKPGRQFF